VSWVIGGDRVFITTATSSVTEQTIDDNGLGRSVPYPRQAFSTSG
jgi:hypothetical protein